MTVSTISSWIRESYKIELHIHLEGTLNIKRIISLAGELGERPPRPFEDLFKVFSLPEFLSTLDWICGLVRKESHVRAIARDFLDYAKTQNLIYVELIVNPGHWKLDYDELFGPLNDEFLNAAVHGGPDVRILPSIGRSDSSSQAMALAQWCVSSGLPALVGLSIDGDERNGSYSHRFAPAFSLAAEHGLPCTAHAGESSPASGVVEALDLLGVQRIDHGVRAIELPELVGRLVDDEVPLNVCVSSNCNLLYSSIEEHPLAALVDKGVLCTLGTDDPEVTGLNLNQELQRVSEYFGFDEKQMIQFQQNAAIAAFCDEETKALLTEMITSSEPRSH